MQLNAQALTSIISAAVAQAIKAVHQASVPSTAMPTPSAAVEQVVQIEVLSYTPGTIDQAPLTAVIGAYNQPSQPFYSIAVNFGSRER